MSSRRSSKPHSSTPGAVSASSGGSMLWQCRPVLRPSRGSPSSRSPAASGSVGSSVSRPDRSGAVADRPSSSSDVTNPPSACIAAHDPGVDPLDGGPARPVGELAGAVHGGAHAAVEQLSRKGLRDGVDHPAGDTSRGVGQTMDRSAPLGASRRPPSPDLLETVREAYCCRPMRADTVGMSPAHHARKDGG